MYAILDIEATGGKKGEEDIIEVAIYRFDGKKIVDQLISLVSPDRKIDAYVQKLTQITPKMVKSAPKFHEIAKRIIEITDGAILVGHNVDFDYRMLKQEFRKFGYTYYRETIDTVPLSERYFPEATSYSLGKLSKELGIPVSDRHRAAGDARATLEIFKLLLDKDFLKDISKNEISSETKTSSDRFSEFYNDAPNAIGMFYVFNQNKDVVYLSRSHNISQSIRKVLTGKNALSNRLRMVLESVKYEITGNELISWIKENHELKRLKPTFNERSKKISFPYMICLGEKNGYKTLYIEKSREVKGNGVFRMTSLPFAQNLLSLVTEEFELCPLLNGISKCNENCFSYEIGECHGACVGEESNQSYNERVDAFLEKINLDNKSFLMTGNGRKIGENSFVWIEKGICLGYGYYELNHQIKTPQMIRERMIPVEHDEGVDSIVKGFLFSEKYRDLIPIKL